MPAQNVFPAARKEGLVVERLKDEVLVYDRLSDQASCLNETAALVWKYADGATRVEQIADRVAGELGVPVDTRVVWFALDQLGKKNLLLEAATMPNEFARLTRRDFLKAGLVGAAVAIPVIVSLSAPTAAMAATCPSGCACPNGQVDCNLVCPGKTCVSACCQ